VSWLDAVLVVVAVVALFMGFRLGLVHAAFLLGGLVVGLVLAAQLSGPIGEALTDSVKSEATATAIAYGIVLLAVMAIAQVLGMLLRWVAKALMLGWVDTLGGAAAGLAGGVLLGLAIIAVLARLAFLFDGKAPGLAPKVEARDGLEKALVGSGLAPYYLDLRDALPAASLGMVPGGFDDALDELQRRIDGVEAVRLR